MTVLYRLDSSSAEIAAAFAARQGDDPWAGGHVSPGSFAPIVTAGREFVAGPRPATDPPRRIVPRLWGVPPPRSAGVPALGVLTVRNPDSPFWIGNLRNSEFRCLVPATAWMEWGRTDPRTGKRRQHWFGCAGQPLFAFAAVWKDSEVPSFALVACEPSAALREIGRDTMPAVLAPDPAVWRAWLLGEWGQARALLQPWPSALTEMREP